VPTLAETLLLTRGPLLGVDLWPRLKSHQRDPEGKQGMWLSTTISQVNRAKSRHFAQRCKHVFATDDHSLRVNATPSG
jgi:hypothetical protein